MRRLSHRAAHCLAWPVLFQTAAVVAQELPVNQAVKPRHIGPVWVENQTWRVEFLRPLPYADKGDEGEPPPPQRTVWRYRVVEIASGRTTLSVRREDGTEEYRLRFDTSTLELLDVDRMERARAQPVDETVRGEPYFGWSQSQPVIFDWPVFPAQLPNAPRAFVSSSGQKVEMSIEPRDRGAYEVAFVSTDKRFPESAISRQTWEPDNPWWTTATVATEFRDEDGPETVVNIQGNLLED
jgi:hypothetical protein